jgi:hypothetical protein
MMRMKSNRVDMRDTMGPQIRKLQVCDRCGGRFGMVTHRWWGHKFCKRTCKEAHVREVTLGREVIRRWSGTVRV